MDLFFSKSFAQWHNARNETFRASGTAVMSAFQDARYKQFVSEAYGC